MKKIIRIANLEGPGIWVDLISLDDLESFERATIDGRSLFEFDEGAWEVISGYMKQLAYYHHLILKWAVTLNRVGDGGGSFYLEQERRALQEGVLATRKFNHPLNQSGTNAEKVLIKASSLAGRPVAVMKTRTIIFNRFLWFLRKLERRRK